MTTPRGNAEGQPENPSPELGIPKRCFYGPSGLRAGWRLLIFTALFVMAMVGMAIVGYPLFELVDRLGNPILPHILQESLLLVCALFASYVMARTEKRKVSEYGLPWRRMFQTRFWQGAGVGFASLLALLLLMRVAGVLHIAGIALHGAKVWTFACSFALLFLLVGLAEEFLSRGYFLFTLSSGIGFRSAAVLASAFFATLHFGPDETWTGLMNAALLGLLFCLLLRSTGDLWMSVGYHAAWDWGQTYFFGVANSGHVMDGHLLNSAVSGPAWLSGASVGPEGSLLCTVLLVGSWFLIRVIFAWSPRTTVDAADD